MSQQHYNYHRARCLNNFAHDCYLEDLETDDPTYCDVEKCKNLAVETIQGVSYCQKHLPREDEEDEQPNPENP